MDSAGIGTSHRYMQVAGLRRACPSTTLDEKWKSVVVLIV
jgi:hypothetical protein